MQPMPITSRERTFIEHHRVARLATADADGVPHVVPICFSLSGNCLYSAIDQKPKRAGARLKRIGNIEVNPNVSVLIDRYDADWSRLGWVKLNGRAAILRAGEVEHCLAQAGLIARYPQYLDMDLSGLPVIAVRISQALHWGNLATP